MSAAKVVFGNPEIYRIIKISVAKTCFSGYTQKNKRCYNKVRRINLLGIKIGLLFSLGIFRIAAASASEPPSLLAQVETAGLITVSALADTESGVQKLPAELFSLISLIDSRGTVVSTKKENNSLVNKVERFSSVSKGKIEGENPFSASGFEAAITGDGTAGKLLIYSDSLFSSPFLYIRWRRIESETEYLRRTFRSGRVTEEVLVIRRDGSGSYRAGQRGKAKEKLRWNAGGEIIPSGEKP